MSTALVENKAEWRRLIRRWLGNLDPEDRRQRSARIVAHLQEWMEGSAARHICRFESLSTEPDLSSLWDLGCSWVLPKVEPNSELSLWRVQSPQQLQRGSYGILEPNPIKSERVHPASVDVFWVPGLAFARKGGWRLGQGGGFYDRLFAQAAQAEWLGVCFREQLGERVPHSGHDTRVTGMITCGGWESVEEGEGKEEEEVPVESLGE